MSIARPGQKLRGAFSRGAGFGVARRLLRGFSFDDIRDFLIGSFGRLSEADILTLVEHGRQMRQAGITLSGLSPGAALSLDQIPVNPSPSPQIYEGARVVSELILPWQIQGTDQEGEWYHRFHHTDIITVDSITDSIETWIADTSEQDTIPSSLSEWLNMQIDVGAFIGVGLERAF